MLGNDARHAVRTAAMVAGTMLAGLATGCMTKEKPVVDTPSAHDTAAVIAGVDASGRPPAQYDSLEGVPRNNAETRSYRASRRWELAGAWAGGIDCDHCTKPRVQVRFIPESRALLPDMDDLFKKNKKHGHFVAALVNEDTTPIRELGNLAPTDTAFLWVGTNGSGKVRYVFYHFEPNGTPVPVARMRKAGWCANTGVNTPQAHVDTSPECKAMTPFYDDAKGIQQLHNSGLWVGCSLGCCQVSQLQ